MKRFIVLVSALIALAACGVPGLGASATAVPSCEDGLPAFAKMLDPLAREWDDANKVANSTPRAALAVQISNLQSVRRRVQDIPTPTCGESMKGHLVKAMDATINGYIAFLGQKPQTEVQQNFDTATSEMKAYQNAVLNISMNAPTATP